MTGFFLTCDRNKEKRCIKEIFNLLNDYTDELYPDLERFQPKEKKVEESTLDALENEIEQLRAEAKEKRYY